VQLQGRLVLITGGGQGIGRGVLERFAAKGATVASVQRRGLPADLEQDPAVHSLQADITAKAGIHGLTRALAVDLGTAGIRVHRSRVDRNRLGPDLPRNLPDPATALEEIKGLHPAGRAGRPDDIGDVAVFLAAGSDFVTGQTIVVDGGRTARLPMPRT